MPANNEEKVPGNGCQLNRSMQHYVLSWSDSTSPREPTCRAVLNQNLARAVFRSIRRSRTTIAFEARASRLRAGVASTH
jgi:hypothetical protein